MTLIWDNFVIGISRSKPRLQNHDDVAMSVHEATVLCAHHAAAASFMPFITESIWQARCTMARRSWFPSGLRRSELYFAAEAEQVETMMTPSAIRARRAEMNVPPSKRTGHSADRRKLLTRWYSVLQQARIRIRSYLRRCNAREC
ncbi:MAG: class I tRNA ligase family protein [Butyricicoccus pullicaecorum]